MSLTNLGSRLGDLGRSPEALRAVTEAVHIYRALPSTRARRVWTNFAVSLNNLAVLLGDLGRHEEALTPSTSAPPWCTGSEVNRRERPPRSSNSPSASGCGSGPSARKPPSGRLWRSLGRTTRR